MGVDTNQAADGLQSVVIFLIVGMAFLWLISEGGKQVMSKFTPVMMFLVIAAAVGAVVVKMLANIF